MLYSKKVTIPANTQKSAFQRDTLQLTKGVITRVSVFFPWGCAGLVGVQIIRGTWQVFPLSRGEWLIGNDLDINFKTDVDLKTEPYEVSIYSYNSDDTFEHSPIVSIEMVKGEVSSSLQSFLRTLGV